MGRPPIIGAESSISTIFVFKDFFQLGKFDSWSGKLFIYYYLLTGAISILFEVVYWIIVFGFGWPLFKDICRYLNIPIKGLFDLPFLGRWKRSNSTT